MYDKELYESDDRISYILGTLSTTFVMLLY